MKQPIYCFVAGGSGGHIIPALTRAQQLNGYNIFFSTESVLDIKIIQTHAAVDKHIKLPVNAIPSLKTAWKTPIWLWHMLYAFFTSFKILFYEKPQEVISTGGLVSIPVVLAARLLRIPVTLYELNVEPGKATQFLAPYASTINIVFPETARYLPRYSCTRTEYPLQNSLLQLERISTDKTTIMVLGGSQGSVSLNSFAYQLFTTHFSNRKDIHIIHQTGLNDKRNWNTIYKTLGISHTVFTFSENLETFYRTTDFVLCRAGAGTLCEIEHLNIPCITVPLETSYTKHQRLNAYSMAHKHPDQFTVITQDDITSHPEQTYRICAERIIKQAIQMEPIPSSEDTNLFQLGE